MSIELTVLIIKTNGYTFKPEIIYDFFYGLINFFELQETFKKINIYSESGLVIVESNIFTDFLSSTNNDKLHPFDNYTKKNLFNRMYAFFRYPPKIFLYKNFKESNYFYEIGFEYYEFGEMKRNYLESVNNDNCYHAYLKDGTITKENFWEYFENPYLYITTEGETTDIEQTIIDSKKEIKNEFVSIVGRSNIDVSSFHFLYNYDIDSKGNSFGGENISTKIIQKLVYTQFGIILDKNFSINKKKFKFNSYKLSIFGEKSFIKEAIKLIFFIILVVVTIKIIWGILTTIYGFYFK